MAKMMGKRTTPLLDVRKEIMTAEPGRDILVVITVPNCPSCTKQHYENEKAAYYRPMLKRYLVDATEWNSSFGQTYAVSAAPTVYLGNKKDGLKFIREGLVNVEELLELIPI